ncbi:MAG TPA: MFS transporter [Candidatus Thermoplasmatota archaeon]|nr:MFS transporter [Candidatus Thermoplasmatota archaeon]
MSSPTLERKRPAAPPRWFFAFVPANIANGASSPLIPLYMLIVLHASVFEVGLVFVAASLAAVPGAVFWGRLSDKLHRRRAFVIVGLASFAVTLPLMALTSSLLVYLAANALLGFLQAAGAATSSVLIMENFKTAEWARQIGRFAEVTGAAFVGGLLLGAVWFLWMPAQLGEGPALQLMFALCAALSAASAVLGAVSIREGHRRVDRAAAIDALAHLGHSILEKRRLFLGRLHNLPSFSFASLRRHGRGPIGAYSAGIFLLFTGFLVFNAPLPVFLLEEASLPQALVFWVYLASSALAAALYYPAGRRCERGSPASILVAASAVRIAAYPAFALALLVFAPGSAALILLLMGLNALAGASWAFINVGGSVVAARLAPPDAKAQVMGLYNAAIGAGSIAGSFLGGLLAQHFPYLQVFAAASLFIAVGAGVVAVSSGSAAAQGARVRAPSRVAAALGLGRLQMRPR